MLSLEAGRAAGEDGELTALRDAMAARGPDGCGLWFGPERKVGLAHRRLAIIDPSSDGAQPMRSAYGALCISFNGEIYNHRALRRELSEHGVVFRTQSDTEVLLHLYRRYGAEMVGRLRGMFAFALWDGERQGVLLARDPFGIKPLYYARAGHRLIFASQARPLAALTTGGVCAAGLVGFLVFGYVPEPHTVHQGVEALPAGTTLWIGPQGVGAPRSYFSIAGVLSAAEGERGPGGSVAALRPALLESLRHHLVSDVPVGLFLSAGVDSGVLLALATEVGGAGMATRTLAFEEFCGTLDDEAPLAERVAAHYGAAHQTHRLTASGFEGEMESLLAAMAQPSIDGVNTYFVARATARSGLKVALSGVGGDEMFGGYPSFRQIPRLTRLLAPFAPVPGLWRALRRVTAPLLPGRVSPKLAGLLEYGTTVPDAWLLRRALFMPWELPGIIEPALAAAGWEALDARVRLAATVADLRHPRLQVMALELGWYMRCQLLRDADWAGMAHGLEIRTPLVCADLFRALAPLLVAASPPGKSALTAIARPPLPDGVTTRPKTGFSTPLAGWLAAQKPGAQRRGLRDWALMLARRRLGPGLITQG